MCTVCNFYPRKINVMCADYRHTELYRLNRPSISKVFWRKGLERGYPHLNFLFHFVSVANGKKEETHSMKTSSKRNNFACTFPMHLGSMVKNAT